jgi:hypothetical protein
VITLLLYGVFVVFAAPPGTGGYNPGETLNPECAPGDTIPEPCIVKLPTGWSLTGDAGTDGGVTNFIGTTDAVDFVIKVNGSEMGRFYENLGPSQYSVALGGGQALSSGMFVFGFGAGTSATNAAVSNFIGVFAGENATNASFSNFIGYEAGYAAVNSENSNFFGQAAGKNATDAYDSNFFGQESGLNATNAYSSNFFGAGAGNGAVDARFSNFFGYEAGYAAVNSENSNFFGQAAGQNATDAYDSNFFGQESGLNATNAYSSNFFGAGAGNGAVDARFSNFFGQAAGLDATNSNESNFFGPSAGQNATNADNSNFFGQAAGLNATNAAHSVFLGRNAGASATNADNSNFFGYNAGGGATTARYSNFFGYNAGGGATTADNSNFFGQAAGLYAIDAHDSTFIGYRTGFGSVNAYNSNFIGKQAGENAPDAANSIFMGTNAGNGDVVDNTTDSDDYSILIGNNTSTGGFENSIALGANAINTLSNQFMIGSSTRPIDEIRVVQTGGTECIIDTSGLGCTSDERLKTNIANLTSNTLDTLLNVRTVKYNWLNNPNGNTMVGFLAQDLEQYFPELVATNERGQKSVYYAQMTPILVEAIRELNMKVNSLQLATVGSSDITQVTESFRTWLADAGNGIVRIFAKTVRVSNGIEMVDRSTGEIYCTYIENGEFKKLLGQCTDEIVSSPSNTVPEITSNSPSDNTDVSDPDLTTPIDSDDSIENTETSTPPDSPVSSEPTTDTVPVSDPGSDTSSE